VVRKEAPPPVVATPQPATADAPQLEPANSSQQQASIQQEVTVLQSGIEARIQRLSRVKLAAADRKTLEDARTFIAQSEAAKKSGDFTQASNLAKKADLLVQAIEKRY
jgi:electron transfer flavoprotein alpha subunit